MITYDEFKKRFEEDEEKLPLLTLDEFFEDNEAEDSIAPNEIDEGRPTLAEMYNYFNDLESMDGIDWIRVELHDDTYLDDEEEILELAGESILIATSLSEEEIVDKVHSNWLCADGVSSFDYEELSDYYTNIPELPEGSNCYEICWD